MAESDAVSALPGAATCEECGVELAGDSRDLGCEPTRDREPTACAPRWQPAAHPQVRASRHPASFPATIPAATASEPAGTPGWRRQQRLQALSKANEIRVAQAQLKKELASGTAQIRGILTQPPDYAANLRVSKLLRAVPGYGPARVARILVKTCISESTRLAGLTHDQRSELINHVHR